MKNIKLIIILFTLLSFLCINDPTDPLFYEELFNIETRFCLTLLNNHLIFQNQIPPQADTFSLPESLFSAIGDSYTWYGKKDSAERFSKSLSTHSQIPGTGISIDPQTMIITDITPKSPGFNADLFVGDSIIATNGYNDADSILKHLEVGYLNDSLTISLLRNNIPLEITVVYNFFYRRSVQYSQINVNDTLAVAYIKISSFSDFTCTDSGTSQEFIEALDKSQWAPSIILDLRGNSGGANEQYIKVISALLPANTPIIKTKQRLYESISETYKTVNDTLWTLPNIYQGVKSKIYVLMDSICAGETEILIASFHDHIPLVTTLGTKSKGKARIQTLFPVPGGGIASITSTLVEPLKGLPFDSLGIQPKVFIPDTADLLEKTLAIIMGN